MTRRPDRVGQRVRVSAGEGMFAGVEGTVAEIVASGYNRGALMVRLDTHPNLKVQFSRAELEVVGEALQGIAGRRKPEGRDEAVSR